MHTHANLLFPTLSHDSSRSFPRANGSLFSLRVKLAELLEDCDLTILSHTQEQGYESASTRTQKELLPGPGCRQAPRCADRHALRAPRELFSVDKSAKSPPTGNMTKQTIACKYTHTHTHTHTHTRTHTVYSNEPAWRMHWMQWRLRSTSVVRCRRMLITTWSCGLLPELSAEKRAS
jgi:hypothetical protein